MSVSTHETIERRPNTLEYTWVTDAGHGWLMVHMEEINALNIAGQISEYSYMDRRTGLAYLEEDCDASVFLDALREKLPRWEDVRFNTVNFKGDAPCRGFRRFGQ